MITAWWGPDPLVGPRADRRSWRRLGRRFSVRACLGGRFRFDQPGFEFLAQPIALPFDVDRDRVLEESIENGRGNHGIAEDFAPVAETLIARQNDRAPFVATRDELEEQIGALPINRNIADLIDNQQVGVMESKPCEKPNCRW